MTDGTAGAGGWISPRWVPVMVYGIVAAAGLYYGAAGLAGAGPSGPRLAGFAAVMAALLAIDARRWPGQAAAGRRRGAVALLAARLALFAAAVALDPSGESRVLFVLVPFAAYFTFGRPVSMALAGLCLALLVASFTLRVPHWYARPAYLSDVLMFGVGLVLAIAMASVAVGEQAGRSRLEAALRELGASHARLTAYAGRVAELSAEAERTRLARDIHDSLGHHLTAIAVQLEKAEEFRDRDQAAADRAVADARASAREALRDVRASVSSLRGGDPAAPLAAMIAALIGPDGAGGPLVTLSVTGEEGQLSGAARATLYRAAQEALTNARRHSGAARVTVSLALGDREARLVVADDGRGFDPGAPGCAGFGLPGIRERASLAGGQAAVASAPGTGTTVTVTVPRSAGPAPGLAAAPSAVPA
jgi:signal transduction histidine kinase